MTFEKWMDAVDDEFISVTGLDRDMWPDQDYWCEWDSGTSPSEMLSIAIHNEYGEYGLEAFGLELV